MNAEGMSSSPEKKWSSYYDVLDISPDADDQTIRRAYREKMRANHPDAVGINSGHADWDKKNFDSAMINEAYNVLKDPFRRMQYRQEVGLNKTKTDPEKSEKKHNESNPPTQPKRKRETKGSKEFFSSRRIIFESMIESIRGYPRWNHGRTQAESNWPASLGTEYRFSNLRETIKLISRIHEISAINSRGNFYEVLGIFPDSSLEEIKSSYKRLSRLLDLNSYPLVGASQKLIKDAQEKMKIVREAYFVLKDDRQRDLYNDWLRYIGSPLLNIAKTQPSTWDNYKKAFEK